MKPHKKVPQSVVREWLAYNSKTGIFVWKKEPRPERPLVGQVAGTREPNAYVLIKLRKFGFFSAQRLAWIWMYGEIPEGCEIDHIDGNPSNNAIRNLRVATSSQQKMNKRVQSNNRSGMKGAYYHAAHKGKKWRSQIRVRGTLVFLGYFNTADEAHAAYVEAAKKYFGAFARAA